MTAPDDPAGATSPDPSPDDPEQLTDASALESGGTAREDMARAPRRATPGSGSPRSADRSSGRRRTRAAKAAPDRSGEAVELGQHLEHDLVGSAADRQQPRVPEEARRPRLLHVAHAAVELHAGVGDLAGEPA